MTKEICENTQTLDYTEEFAKKFLPREKWGIADTISGIKLPFGFEHEEPNYLTLNNRNMNALLVGMAGAGKTATLNQLITTLVTMYPPSDLQIIYVDFKDVEVEKFINRGSNTPRLPHMKHLLAGTVNGAFGLQALKEVKYLMDERRVLLDEYNVVSIQRLRENILEKYNHDNATPNGTWAEMRNDWYWYKKHVYSKYGDLPRILVIFDEYQVMYNKDKVGEVTINAINGLLHELTKKQEETGIHFMFASQAPAIAMSSDLNDTFKLRCALRCNPIVSEEVLGTTIAGDITEKYGRMYTKDATKVVRYWQVPFLPEKEMLSYFEQVK